MTDEQIFSDADNVSKHANRTQENLASLVETSLAESVESITRADSPEPDRDISLHPLTQGDTTQDTRDGHFFNRGSVNITNQTRPMQIKDLWNGKKPLALLTWVDDEVRGESSTDGSRVREREGPPPIRLPYRRPTVEDYKYDGSRSPSPHFSHRSRRENRYGDSRSSSPRFSYLVRRKNRYGGSRSPSPEFFPRYRKETREEARFRKENRNGDSTSPSSRRENSFDSERKWRDKQTRAYASGGTPSFNPDPPQLTFYWASQIDIQLGCWATPWQGGMFSGCIDALDMMVDMGLAGLSETARLTQPKVNWPAVDSHEIIYAEFPHAVILRDLWVYLREGQHTWPPYAINARGGVRGLATHLLVQHSAFRDDERLPQLTFLNSVHKAGMSTAETSTAPQVLERDRIFWS